MLHHMHSRGAAVSRASSCSLPAQPSPHSARKLHRSHLTAKAVMGQCWGCWWLKYRGDGGAVLTRDQGGARAALCVTGELAEAGTAECRLDSWPVRGEKAQYSLRSEPSYSSRVTNSLRDWCDLGLLQEKNNHMHIDVHTCLQINSGGQGTQAHLCGLTSVASRPINLRLRISAPEKNTFRSRKCYF